MGDQVYWWTAAGEFQGPFSPVDAAKLAARVPLSSSFTLTEGPARTAFTSGIQHNQQETRSILLPALRTRDPFAVSAVREWRTGDDVVFEVSRASERERALSDNEGISVEDIGAFIIRAAQETPDVAQAVWLELTRQNALLYSSQLSRVTSGLLQAPGTFDDKAWTERVNELQGMRSEYGRLHLDANRIEHGNGETAPALADAIKILDGLGASVLMHLIFIQNRSFVEARAAEQLATNRAAVRDRWLALWAAVLLLPSLWFGLLGTNVIPSRLFGLQIPGATAFMLTLGGGLTLGIFGAFVITAYFNRKDE